MQVSVETTQGLERRMTVEIPLERIDDEIKKRLQNLTRTAKVDGFRAGKVPLNVIQRMYGQQVREDVVTEVLERSFYEAVAEQNLMPVGMPNIQSSPPQEGKGLEYVATFEVYPQIELASCDGMAITKPVIDLTETDIDQVLEKIRLQRAQWIAADRPAQNGDRVTVDFVGTVAGQPFKGNEGKNVPVELGRGRMIAGFEEKLIGAGAGQDLTLELSFPEDYHFRDIAGRPVSFKVTVHTVEEAKLPAIDETFVRELGFADGDIETLRGELRESLGREVARAVQVRLKRQVMDKLYEINSFEIPTMLLDKELDLLRKQAEAYSEGQVAEGMEDQLRAQAHRRVMMGLILSELIKLNDLKASPERVREEVVKIASTYEQPEEVVKWYYGEQRHLADIEAVVLEDMVVDWVLERAAITETNATLDELLGTPA